MTNLDSILKIRDITLPTKVHLVKAMVFPVVMLTKDQLTLLNQESAVCGSEAPRAAVWILTKLPPTLQLPVTWLLLIQMNP